MTTQNGTEPGAPVWTPARERALLLTLAAIQFTTILDFVIILPLGPQFRSNFHIVTWQFELIVGAYGLAAGLAGLAAGFFLDRFDRKTALVWVYAGFALGTLFCAVASTYHMLVAARFVAGAFGGLCSPVVLAIVGDVIPLERRGRAMGLVMSSFSVASIIGVPAGLLVANAYSWHVSFYAIAALSAIIVGVAAAITPPLRAHMEHKHDDHPFARTWAVIVHPDHQKAYLFMAALTCAGFLVFSVVPTYLVTNAGILEKQLPYMYVFGGLCTVFSMNWIGRWTDRSGRFKVFTITSLSCAVPILLVTNLPHVPLAAAIAAFSLLMVCMSGRMVPAMAIMTSVVEARYRGGFMSINSAVQQFSMGITSFLAGAIIREGPNGEMTRFSINGLLAIFCAYWCIYLAKFLKPAATIQPATEPVLVEMG